MSSQNKNLSESEGLPIPNAKDFKFGIVYSEWNYQITNALKEGAIKTLLENGAKPENIVTKAVPGSFELTLGAQYLAEFSLLFRRLKSKFFSTGNRQARR